MSVGAKSVSEVSVSRVCKRFAADTALSMATPLPPEPRIRSAHPSAAYHGWPQGSYVALRGMRTRGERHSSHAAHCHRNTLRHPLSTRTHPPRRPATHSRWAAGRSENAHTAVSRGDRAREGVPDSPRLCAARPHIQAAGNTTPGSRAQLPPCLRAVCPARGAGTPLCSSVVFASPAGCSTAPSTRIGGVDEARGAPERLGCIPSGGDPQPCGQRRCAFSCACAPRAAPPARFWPLSLHTPSHMTPRRISLRHMCRESRSARPCTAAAAAAGEVCCFLRAHLLHSRFGAAPPRVHATPPPIAAARGRVRPIPRPVLRQNWVGSRGGAGCGCRRARRQQPNE